MTRINGSDERVSPSAALLAAAFVGLLGSACSSDGDAKPPATDSTSMPAVEDRKVTSTVVTADMTQDKFKADCDERGGTVEVHPHCGGFNTCMGFSYDTGTMELTEHNCMGLNTCTGYSCIIKDET